MKSFQLRSIYKFFFSFALNILIILMKINQSIPSADCGPSKINHVFF